MYIYNAHERGQFSKGPIERYFNIFREELRLTEEGLRQHADLVLSKFYDNDLELWIDTTSNNKNVAIIRGNYRDSNMYFHFNVPVPYNEVIFRAMCYDVAKAEIKDKNRRETEREHAEYLRLKEKFEFQEMCQYYRYFSQ